MPAAHGGAPPPNLAEILLSWPFEPLAWVAVAASLWWYAAATRRVRGWPAPRSAAFGAGLAACFLALAGPPAALAHASFAWHMAQHLLLTLVAAPALLLGAPAALALRSSSPAARRRLVRLLRNRPVHLLTHPALGWTAFTGVMWASHFTPLYDAALASAPLHAAEHALYLGAALLFWAPVVGLDPGRARLSPPARLAYLILALPPQSFLGLALWSAREVLYRHYEVLGAPRALADQRVGAVVMWVGGDLLFVAALAAAAIAWMRHDEREAARIDRRLAGR